MITGRRGRVFSKSLVSPALDPASRGMGAPGHLPAGRSQARVPGTSNERFVVGAHPHVAHVAASPLGRSPAPAFAAVSVLCA